MLERLRIFQFLNKLCNSPQLLRTSNNYKCTVNNLDCYYFNHRNQCYILILKILILFFKFKLFFTSMLERLRIFRFLNKLCIPKLIQHKSNNCNYMLNSPHCYSFNRINLKDIYKI